MIDKKLQDAINNQINKEFAASYTYLAMAAHLDSMFLKGFASWMEKQSDEERGHGQKLLRYMLDRGGNVQLAAIPKPEAKLGSVKHVIELSLAQERENTAAIYDIYELARELKDYASQQQMEWFIQEQVEEEKTVSDILGRLEFAGDDKSALLILDDQMGQRPKESAPELE